jgi:hypothetical protein
MKKNVLIVGLLLLVGIPVFGVDSPPITPALDPVVAQDAAPATLDALALPDAPVAPIVMATNCYPAYQACRNNCAGNPTCLANCLDWYNACRFY